MEIGKIQKAEITSELSKSYLDYAMSVIVARALPDIKDGLKPVHRRILYAMHQMGLLGGGYTKSAKVVGEVLGKFHPHGDMAVYDALVRLAQDFSIRYPLVDGQGNFGSVDGDPPAAMRYCVTANSLIITDKGLNKIVDLKKRNPHIKVLSWDNKINNATKWFDSGSHPTKTIITYRGLSLTGTLNHPILTLSKDTNGKPSFQWTMLGGIKKGDYCVINRSPIFFPEDPLLPNYYPHPANSRVEIKKLPERLTSELAFLLGSWAAEGNISKEQVGFANSDREYLDRFKTYFKLAFPDTKLHEFKRKPQGFTKKNYYSLEIHSTFVIEFLKNLGLPPVRAGQKQVPQIILAASQKTIASFLKGYAEGDGSVYISGAPEIAFISKSLDLMKEMQILLLRFGIESSCRFQPSRKIYKLLIRGRDNLQIFAKKIGFVSKRKLQKLHQAASLNKDGLIMSKTDFIPYLAEYLRKNVKYRGHLEWLKKHNLDRYSKLKKYWLKLKTFLNKESIELIESLLEKNFLFDQVAEIKNSGNQNVYSLRVVSNDHSFVSNGFISHNTEVRLAPIAGAMLADIEKETVDLTDNFDATIKEPVFLPALLPNLLLMGSEGIAVGMATKIPTHNLGEIVDAALLTIKEGKAITQKEAQEKETEFFIKKINLVASGAEKEFNETELKPTSISFESEISLDSLLAVMPGPDFPTAGAIYDAASLHEVYATGRGKILVRGIATIEDGPKGRSQIIITEIPYQVNKARLVAKIADLVKEKKIIGIADLRDESDKDGMRVVVELKRDAKPKSVLNNLFKHTLLQTTFPANFVALVDGVPQTVNLKTILVEYVKHRQHVVIRRTIFELTAAKRRAHILEGLKIALDNLDAVIKTIRGSRTQEDAKNNLIEKFGLTEIQATAILDMQLRRLAALEREKIEAEYAEISKLIERLTLILKSPAKVLEVISSELTDLKAKFGDARRTKIYKQNLGEFSEEDLIPKEDTLITITRTGYIKRVPRATFRSQQRGGKGVLGMTTKEEDEIEHIISATTHDSLLFFTTKGRVFGAKTWDIPESSRQAKGQALVNLVNLDADERVLSILPLNGNGANHLIMATKLGTIKKTRLSEFTNLRASGLIAIKLDRGDSLVSVHATSGADFILLLTRSGKSIKFPEENVRPMGRSATGVRGISLEGTDELIGMEVFPQKEVEVTDGRRKVFRDILTISERGLGKRTPVKSFPTQKRGGKGVKAAEVTAKTGQLASATMVTEVVDQIVLNSKKGQVIKLPIKNIPELGRATQGVILMRFTNAGDSVAAVTTLEKTGEEEVEA